MNKLPKNTLPKAARVYRKNDIQNIFSHGQSFWKFPFSVHYLPLDAKTIGFQIGVSVPKKKFKRAVDRNRIKRIIKEAFRTTRRAYETKLNQSIGVFVVYKHDKLPELEEVKAKFVFIFEKILKEQEK